MKILLCSILSVCVLLGAESVKVDKLTLENGKEYVVVTVSKKNDYLATIEHESGLSTVKISSLPKDLQKKLGYDQEKALEYQKREVILQKKRDDIKKKLKLKEIIAKSTIMFEFKSKMALGKGEYRGDCCYVDTLKDGRKILRVVDGFLTGVPENEMLGDEATVYLKVVPAGIIKRDFGQLPSWEYVGKNPDGAGWYKKK